MQRILIYSILLLAFRSGFSSEMAKTKKIAKEWTVNPNANVTFSTKYQDVEMVFRNDNKVRLEVTVNCTEDISTEDIEDKLEITSEVAGNNLIISTRLKPDSESKSIWNTLFGSKKCADQISMTSVLYLPVGLGELSIVSKYSDLKCDIIPMGFTLKSGYGDINISELKKSSDIIANYSDLKINKADNLDITCNHSDVFISEINSLKINSNYADLSIDKLNKSLINSCNYGDVKIKDIARDFSSIKCTGTYSDFLISINESHPLQLDIQAKNGDINQDALLTGKIQEDEDANESTLQVKTKSATSSSPTISVTTIYGDITISKSR